MTPNPYSRVRRTFWLMLLIPVLILTGSLMGAIVPNGVQRADDPPVHEVHLIAGPIHYDFLLPLTPETRAAFAVVDMPTSLLQDAKAEWLLVGWGARAVYTTLGSYRDVTAKAVWRGLTGDQPVLRLDVVGALPSDLATRAVPLSAAQYASLVQAILDSFAETAALSQPGFTATDRFYPAKGRFHLARTCNVWISEMLKAANQRFGLWTPLPVSVTLSHWLFVGPGPAHPQ